MGAKPDPKAKGGAKTPAKAPPPKKKEGGGCVLLNVTRKKEEWNDFQDGKK